MQLPLLLHLLRRSRLLAQPFPEENQSSPQSAAMPKKEREAKKAAFAMKQELDSEMTEEQRERLEKSGMGIGGGLNKGEAQLFEKKLTKEEKKAEAEKKKAERAAKKKEKDIALHGEPDEPECTPPARECCVPPLCCAVAAVPATALPLRCDS